MNSLYLAEFDVPVILIVFVVISAIKWFMEKVKNKGEQPHEESESLEDIYDTFREEIRQRQTTVQQPPPVQAQPVQSPPPIPQATPPVVEHAQHAQQRPKPTPVSLPKKPKKVELTAEQKAAAARFERNAQSKRRRKRAPQTSSVHALLSNPQSTRQAIILTEILGKPKSMQDA